MSSFKHLLTLLLLNLAHASTNDPPNWSTHYYVEGEISIPSAEVNEPFQAWYNSKSGKSRIDYYHGMTKTYQFAHKGLFGTSFKFFPFTTENETNIINCYALNGIKELTSFTQMVFPDLSDYKFISKNLIDGKTVEKWEFSTIINDIDVKHTMWLYRNNCVVYPLKREVFSYQHYTIIYKNFSPVIPESKIFYVNESDCGFLNISIADRIYTFNPMREFINNYEEHVDSAFEEFVQHHKKNYKPGTAEHFERKNYFRQNLWFIHSKNRANLGYSLAVNHFADYSNEELKAMMGYRDINVREYNGGKPFPYSQKDFKNLPAEFDWRISGAVTPVKNQGDCSSCWSFSATGAVEGAYFLKYRKRKRFSEQALIDCSWGFNNGGCLGGNFKNAFDWIRKHGLPTEVEYGHYLNQEGYCHVANISEDKLTKISGYGKITSSNDEELKLSLVKHGPMSVSIYVPKIFLYYSKGVFPDENCNSTILNHSMLLVGYGTLEGKPYWLVKNSWSTHWGNDGYALISREGNGCGIKEATYVIM